VKKIPLLDMQAQLAPIRKDIDKAIARVIDRGSFILGKEVRELEEAICSYCGVKYAIGVSNGTDAITLCLEALGIGRGDKVICPSFTYYATAGAVAHTGAEPVFVDIDTRTYCIGPASMEKYISRTLKAIIPVHLYGQCADMEAILKIAKKYKLKVIEDTAQAFGATYNGKIAGTMGDYGIVSFFPGKNLGACGDAGMILTNSKSLADNVRILRNQGASPNNRYQHISLGHNNRLDTIQAAIVKVKLAHIDKWNKKRIKNAAFYNSRLRDIDITTPHVSEDNMHIYHQYILRTQPSRQRDKIVKHLRTRAVDSRVYYPIPLHMQECFAHFGYKKGDLPEAERASRETFAIPVYPELTRRQMEYIVKTIKEVLRKKQK